MKNFINNIKSGVYGDKNGLIEFSNKKYTINKFIELINIDYKNICKNVNVSKEKIKIILMNIIKILKIKLKKKYLMLKK